MIIFSKPIYQSKANTPNYVFKTANGLSVTSKYEFTFVDMGYELFERPR